MWKRHWRAPRFAWVDDEMKVRNRGNETRYDGAAAQIDAARNSAPGCGVFLKYTRWCAKCRKDKPASGAKQMLPGIFKCADCLAG